MIGLAQSYVLMAVSGIRFEVCFCVRLREESCRYEENRGEVSGGLFLATVEGGMPEPCGS